MRIGTKSGLALALICWAIPAWSANGGGPLYGDWGIDTAGMDTSSTPGDDFFRYANGNWLDGATIAADRSEASLWQEMKDRVEDRLHLLLEEAATRATDGAPTTLDAKVGAFFKAFMDEARVEELGTAPLEAELEAIKQAKTREQVAALMGQARVDFYGSLFRLRILPDAKDPTRYSVSVQQGGLGLPDRDYYLKPEFAVQKNAYQEYVATLLGLIGWPEADARANDVVAFETRIAADSWTKAQQRDRLATYNSMSIDELVEQAPAFAWRDYFASAHLPGLDRVVVAEKSAVPKLVATFAGTPVEVLQAYLAFTVVDNASPYLSKPFANANFAMRDQTLAGQQEQMARWKRGVRAVGGGNYLSADPRERFGNMGWGVGQLYTDRYFPAAAKAAIEDLVANVIVAYRERLTSLGWMSAETKAVAIDKLDTYTIKVGYPDNPRDYSSLLIRDDDLVGDVRRAAAHDWTHFVDELPQPVDRSEWYQTPQTVNAYAGLLRDIVFPAGILQPPIFDVYADPAVNYGAAGAVIGHELTHGFDDEGRKVDAAGSLRDWWQPQDASAFVARATKLGAQHGAFAPLPGTHVNAQLTMGENIADLGGVTIALAAYHASLHGKPAPVIDGFTGDQRVFLGWAQVWRGKLRDEALRKQVVSDPHSPRPYRVNGPLRNIDAWYETFGVAQDDALYLQKADRVQIW
jgi:putative endopeptidase